MKRFAIFLTVVLVVVTAVNAAEVPKDAEYVNSVGMKFKRIEPGSFKMGQITTIGADVLPIIDGGDRGGLFDLHAPGDYDERPIHKVKISKAFYMGVFEVTNKQYEMFDPEHKKLRGQYGLSIDDNEAVIYVSWYDATAFCEWLSDKEGLPYRLATEAEWEYACRAGTETNYSTGDTLPDGVASRNGRVGLPAPVSLAVGQNQANQWGLYDMHGNVEEWCNDWYGPYKKGTQKDPVGYGEGDFRVTRGGSRAGTFSYFLRSANRMGMLPADRNWLIGFRVVLGEMPKTKPLKSPKPARYQVGVVSRPMSIVKQGPDPDKPYFVGARKFVKINPNETGPVFAGHNHNPAFVECPNGDLLACWYTCVSEKDRELAQAASRLRYGTDEWEEASPFWDTPDRNDHAPALWYDDKTGKIYHFSPFSVGSTYSTLAVAMRTSDDSGATWSRARIILPSHQSRGHQLSEPVFRMNDGSIAITSDGFPLMWTSPDEGLTWKSCNGSINGIHPGVTQLDDGRILAYIRGGEVQDKQVITTYDDLGTSRVHKARAHRMAKCVSSDGGMTFDVTPSIFPGVDGGQRLVLIKLREGPLFFAGFANRGIIITDAAGKKREVRGMYVAVSEDSGETWSNVKVVGDDGPGTVVMTTNGGYCAMSQRNGEYRGYMTGCQGLDGVINLGSSWSHYAFNLEWLKTPAAPLKYPPMRVKPVVETFSGKDFDNDDWESYHGYGGGFNGKGQLAMISRSHFQGINHFVGEGSFEMNVEVKNLQFNPRGPTSSPGLTIWIKDAFMRRLHFYVRDDRLSVGLQDEEEPRPFPESRKLNVLYDEPPTSAKLKFIYNEKTQRVRIFYGLNGNCPNSELPASKVGIYFGKPLTETTAAYIMMSNGSVDVDYFDIKPISD